MSPRSIFSSYRGGENRVTSTLLAVFERTGFGLTERIIAAALEDTSLSLGSFLNQPSAGGPGVPDGEIRASFRYLIETKTAANSVHVDQLKRHCDRLEGSHADERLIVITPDPEQPAAIDRVGDRRVMWLNFAQLAQAIESVIQDPDELASEQQRFLFRELISYFESEGLMTVDDTVVVAARSAYPEYLKVGAYGCQPKRSIRPVSYFGFYTGKQVKPELARILRHFAAVTFSAEEAEQRRKRNDALESRLADFIEWRLESRPEQRDGQFDVYILSRPDEPETVQLAQPVFHEDRGPWTQGQRYTSVERLRAARTTADL